MLTVNRVVPSLSAKGLSLTPSASWLNRVERWFGLISQRAIKRGSSISMPQLVKTIGAFIEHYNAETSTFIWVAIAESIFAKLERFSARIFGTQHWPPCRCEGDPGCLSGLQARPVTFGLAVCLGIA